MIEGKPGAKRVNKGDTFKRQRGPPTRDHPTLAPPPSLIAPTPRPHILLAIPRSSSQDTSPAAPGRLAQPGQRASPDPRRKQTVVHRPWTHRILQAPRPLFRLRQAVDLPLKPDCLGAPAAYSTGSTSSRGRKGRCSAEGISRLCASRPYYIGHPKDPLRAFHLLHLTTTSVRRSFSTAFAQLVDTRGTKKQEERVVYPGWRVRLDVNEGRDPALMRFFYPSPSHHSHLSAFNRAPPPPATCPTNSDIHGVHLAASCAHAKSPSHLDRHPPWSAIMTMARVIADPTRPA